MQHIQERDLADHGTEQIGMLSERSAHEQSAIRATAYREMVSVGIFLRNQILSRSRKVIEYVLLFVQHSGAMPVLAKFGAAAQIGNGKNSAVLEPQIAISYEARREAYIEAPICR